MHHDWEINCLKADAPQIQVVEIKKAFMSGVAAMFHVLTSDITEISDDAAYDYMEQIDAELTVFFTDWIHKP